jgi:hypothetical protein
MATKTIAGIARAALASRAAAAECCSTAARRHGRALREPALGGGKLRDAGQALGQASGEGIHWGEKPKKDMVRSVTIENVSEDAGRRLSKRVAWTQRASHCGQFWREKV